MNGAKIAYSLFKCTVYILLGDVTHKFCFVNIFAVLTFESRDSAVCRFHLIFVAVPSLHPSFIIYL